MQIGDIDIVNSLLQCERDIKVLQQFVGYLAVKNTGLKYPSNAELEEFKKKALKEIQEKYPNMDIKRNQ